MLHVTFKEHEAILQVHWNDVSIQIILNSGAVCSYISNDNCNIVLLYIPIMYTSIGSGSDDPANPGHSGHFFSGSSGSHPRNKLSRCDPDN